MTDLPVTLMRFLALLAASCAIPCSFGVAGRPEPPPLGLKPATVEAFNQYVHLTDSRSEADLRQGADLLWIDSLDAQARNDAYAALKRGEVKIKKLETLENGSPIHCPNGLVHHWIAVVFIPRAKLSDVLAVLQDYDHHSDYYAPDVERSKLEQHDANHFRAFLRFRRHKVVTVVLDTEHDVRYFVVETHGLLNAQPRPVFAVWAPVVSPAGVAVFARDAESSAQVWSASHGYPGDFDYRDFYRDAGFDLDYEQVRELLPASGERD